MTERAVRPALGPALWQVVRFGLAGVAGLLVDVGVLYLMLALGLDHYSGRLLSFLAAVWATWQLNRRYTFAATDDTLWRQWWRYLLAMTGGGLVNYAAYSAILLMAPSQPRWLPLLAVAGGSLAGMAVNFLSAKLLVFRRG